MNASEEIALVKEVTRLGENLNNLDKKLVRIEDKVEQIQRELNDNKMGVVKISTILFLLGGLLSALASQIVAIFKRAL